MCLITFALQKHPRYPLVMVANRDEFYARPTQTLHDWQDNPAILGGRDLEQGGSWLAIHKTHGKLAAVTNVRNGRESAQTLRSRGHLIRDYLNNTMSAADYATALKMDGHTYGAFNLLLADPSGMHYVSNRTTDNQPLTSGLYGLSNATLNTPWPKLTTACNALQDALTAPSLKADSLISLLSSPQPAEDARLPDTGISLEWERLLSSCFIHSAHYGTRASTVILLDRNGQLTMLEQSYNAQGLAEQRTSFSLQSTLLSEMALLG